MKITSIYLLGAALLAPIFSGCYVTADGHTKLGLPTAFAGDSMSGRYMRTVDQVFAAAKQVLIANGKLTSENTITKILIGQVDERTVWVSVTPDEPTVTRVTVQARKSGGAPDRDWAHEIEKQIALKLANP